MNEPKLTKAQTKLLLSIGTTRAWLDSTDYATNTVNSLIGKGVFTAKPGKVKLTKLGLKLIYKALPSNEKAYKYYTCFVKYSLQVVVKASSEAHAKRILTKAFLKGTRIKRDWGLMPISKTVYETVRNNQLALANLDIFSG